MSDQGEISFGPNAGRGRSRAPRGPDSPAAPDRVWQSLPGSGDDKIPSRGPGGPGDSLQSVIPERYEIRQSEDGFFLHCDEAPRVRVVIDRKLSVSETESRTMGERVIFLDGAAAFGPLLDNKTRLYNLDHHQGCIRPFTLATCEQAMVLVLSGLELDEGDWTIYANEPDLDTVFAIWVLLNFRRLPKLSPRSRDILLPLLRLEGAIDANGNELSEFCGLPMETLRRTRGLLDALYGLEKQHRSTDRWHNSERRDFAVRMLWELDQLIYSREDFDEYTNVEEILGHVEISQRKVAVACRDQAGIYEAERLLKARWGEQLGIIALEKSCDGGIRDYTLRRVSAILDFDLNPAYELLNLVDPAVDGRPANKRWGGSDDIGGSPRPTGTAFPPVELLRLIQQAYRPISRGERLWPVIATSLTTLSVLCVGGIAAFAAALIPELRIGWLGSLTNGAAGLLAFSSVMLIAAVALTWSVSKGRYWLFGWRRPAGHDWLPIAPLALLAALPATVWVPRAIPADATATAAAIGVVCLAALASESFFRGLLHGWFLTLCRVQHVKGPWFVSRANAITALLYGATCCAIALAWRSNQLSPFSGQNLELGITAGAALVGGLSLGIMRERSLSIWPGLGTQILGGLAGALLLRLGML